MCSLSATKFHTSIPNSQACSKDRLRAGYGDDHKSLKWSFQFRRSHAHFLRLRFIIMVSGGSRGHFRLARWKVASARGLQRICGRNVRQFPRNLASESRLRARRQFELLFSPPRLIPTLLSRRVWHCRRIQPPLRVTGMPRRRRGATLKRYHATSR